MKLVPFTEAGQTGGEARVLLKKELISLNKKALLKLIL